VQQQRATAGVEVAVVGEQVPAWDADHAGSPDHRVDLAQRRRFLERHPP
jgi:hypothetical protein